MLLLIIKKNVTLYGCVVTSGDESKAPDGARELQDYSGVDALSSGSEAGNIEDINVDDI